MCFRDAAMLTSACLTLVIWSSMSSYDRSSISSGRSAASSALLALALTMSWARWKRDIPACFLSATACTCLPASTLRRHLGRAGQRLRGPPRRGRDRQLCAEAPSPGSCLPSLRVGDAEGTGGADGQRCPAADRDGGERVGVAEVDVAEHGQADEAVLASDDLLQQRAGHAARLLKAADHQALHPDGVG